MGVVEVAAEAGGARRGRGDVAWEQGVRFKEAGIANAATAAIVGLDSLLGLPFLAALLAPHLEGE